MDIRRTILWLIFAFSILLLWNNWQTHQGRPSSCGTTPAADTAAQSSSTENADSARDPSVPQVEQASRPTRDVPQEAAAQPESELITVHTEVFDLTFDSTGAQLISARLLRYDAPGDDDGPIDRKSTRLNSSHVAISYAGFCLKK